MILLPNKIIGSDGETFCKDMEPKVIRDQICNLSERYGTKSATKKIMGPNWDPSKSYWAKNALWPINDNLT